MQSRKWILAKFFITRWFPEYLLSKKIEIKEKQFKPNLECLLAIRTYHQALFQPIPFYSLQSFLNTKFVELASQHTEFVEFVIFKLSSRAPEINEKILLVKKKSDHPPKKRCNADIFKSCTNQTNRPTPQRFQKKFQLITLTPIERGNNVCLFKRKE